MNLRALVGKVNDTTRGVLEAAAGLCLARTHYDIEIEHFLLKLLDVPDGDFASILKAFSVDKSRLAGEINRSLDKLKSGNARTPAFSPTLVDMIREGWVVGSLEFGAAEIRSGFTILALVSNDDLARIAREIGKELQKIEPETLKKEFGKIVLASRERGETATAPYAGESGEPGAPRPAGGKTGNLDQFTVDLTANAKAGKIDPVLGRDFEIRQIVDILTRRRQNNPILTGEAGVGKTAVVEGFALRVVAGDVPPVLRNVTVRTLDLALLQAGAGIKGEFENRLKGLIEEVKNSPTPIILFIDEAHTMIGAGGQAGQNDAANLLKPALARGELRTIAATTWSEYKKYFEKDPALARRFQVVKVEEPSEEQCRVMLRGVVPALEKHHGVRILDEGLAAAVRFSHRYLPDRHLPDKAVSVLDTACARLALGQNATPPAIEDAIRQIDDFAVQTRVLERESALGADHAERLQAIAEARKQAEERLDSLRARWEKERTLVTQIREIRSKLEESSAAVLTGSPASVASASPAASAAHATAQGSAATAPAPSTSGATQVETAPPDPATLRAELALLNNELDQIQGESPLIRICVDSHIVGDVVSAWTGIPI